MARHLASWRYVFRVPCSVLRVLLTDLWVRYKWQPIQICGISDDALLLFFLIRVSCLNLVSSGSGLLDLVNWASLSMGMIDLRPFYWGGRSLKNPRADWNIG